MQNHFGTSLTTIQRRSALDARAPRREGPRRARELRLVGLGGQRHVGRAGPRGARGAARARGALRAWCEL